MEEYSKEEVKLLADPRFPVKLENLEYTELKNGIEIGVGIKSLKDNKEYVKCPRCWVWHGVKENYDYLCDRCWPILIKNYPTHWSIPHIKKSIKTQRKKYGIKEEECKIKID